MLELTENVLEWLVWSRRCVVNDKHERVWPEDALQDKLDVRGVLYRVGKREKGWAFKRVI